MSNLEYCVVRGLWGRATIQWRGIDPAVNILVGINGGGKTTLLNLIYDSLSGAKLPRGMVQGVETNVVDVPVQYVRSFDVAQKRKSPDSLLLEDLKGVINQNGRGTSFFDYRMQMLNYPERAATVAARIDRFFELVNSLFVETGKRVLIQPQTNTMAFDMMGHTIIPLERLSSGEKQLLLILTTVFLQDCRPSVLLLDEPEISLHITWQEKLIGVLRELNPNCQLIMTTHSPSIFAGGWEDKLVFISDLVSLDS